MTDLLMMAGTIDDATQITKDLTTLLVHGVMGLLVVAATITTRWQTKSWVAAGTAFAAGVACWYAVANATVFRDKVGEDLNPKAATPVPGQVLVLDQVPGPASGDVIEVRR